MDKLIAKIAALGIPGLILLIAINATGLAGAAALTAGLAALGPGGMIGGIACLGVAGLIAHGLSEFGFDAIYSGVVKELYKKGETKASILEKIENYPVSKSLKLKLKDQIEKL